MKSAIIIFTFAVICVASGRAQPDEYSLATQVRSMGNGKSALMCKVVPTPTTWSHYNFRWLSPAGETISRGPVAIVTEADLASNAGMGYVCEVFNVKTHKTLRAGYTPAGQLKEVQNSIVTSIYSVEVISDPPRPMDGMPLNLNCRITPPLPGMPRFTWTKNDMPLFNPGPIFRINNFSPADMGVYKCEILTPNGAVTSEYRIGGGGGIRVPVISEPRDYEYTVTESGNVLTLTIFKKAEVHCDFNTKKETEWSHNGTIIARRESDPIFRIKEHDTASVLILKKPNWAQAGLYKCQYYDGGRLVIKTATIIIQDPTRLDMNVREVVKNAGDKYEAHCKILDGSHYKFTDVDVFFRPENRPDERMIVFGEAGGYYSENSDDEEDSFYFGKQRVSSADAGTYTCRIRGTRISASTILRVGGYTYDVDQKFGQIGYSLELMPANVQVAPATPFTVTCLARREGRLVPQPPSMTAPQLPQQIAIQTKNVAQGTVEMYFPNGLPPYLNGTQILCSLGGDQVTGNVYIVQPDVCRPNERRCRSSSRCLPNGKFCDGVRDCDDGSDEDSCVQCDPAIRKCDFNGGRAPIKQTYNVNWECDGEDDCGNGFDESSCPGQLVGICGTNTSYVCDRSQRSIPKAFVCDKEPDCPQREDETDCAAPNVKNLGVRYDYEVRRGDRVELKCEASGKPLPRVIWRFNWNCLPGQAPGMSQTPFGNDRGLPRHKVSSIVMNCNSFGVQTVVSTLIIENAQPGDDGMYNCEAIAGSQRHMSNNYVVSFPRI